MEEAPENGKESPHSVHTTGLIDENYRAQTYPHDSYGLYSML